jgi:hypothetical protein
LLPAARGCRIVQGAFVYPTTVLPLILDNNSSLVRTGLPVAGLLFAALALVLAGLLLLRASLVTRTSQV